MGCGNSKLTELQERKALAEANAAQYKMEILQIQLSAGKEEQKKEAEKAKAEKLKADKEKAKADKEKADKAKADKEKTDKAKADKEKADKAKADKAAKAAQAKAAQAAKAGQPQENICGFCKGNFTCPFKVHAETCQPAIAGLAAAKLARKSKGDAKVDDKV
jgi:predicted phage gp36 major capsid-like protein